MKALISLALITFAAQAQAVVGFDNAQPFILCKNQVIHAKLIATPNQKDAQLVVNDLRLDRNPNVVYNALVHPVAARDQHFYVNAQASLRVTADGKSLRGFLNMNRQRPGVEQVLECQTYFRILPDAQLRPVL